MKPCEQLGPEMASDIDDLIEAATGKPCPGRMGMPCPFARQHEEERPALRVVS